ncbi:MAG: type II secretion system secretin GspD [Roseiarcus sp.]
MQPPVELKRRRAAMLGGLVFLTLGGCSPATLDQRDDQPQNAADVVRAADLQPHYPQASRTVDTGAAPARPWSIFGTATPTPAASSTAASSEAEGASGDPADGFTLNFDNSPVTNVAKVVLGDILGVGYVVDPRAQGSISLSSGRPISKKDMLFVLENALRANDLALVREGVAYRIAPVGEASVGSIDRANAEPGYGVTVVPLQYVSGATIAHLLEGFAARPGAIRTDASGSLLLVVGSGSERQAALETVREFDVDWLRGQSVGMYPVQNSAPEPIVAELEKIMDSGESGLGHGLVKFQAVQRQNAILVVTAKPELLASASRWIARLDSPSAAGASVKVYKMRYGDAKQIAQLLNDMFVRGGQGDSLETPTNEIAPASGAKPLTTTQRLTGGKSAETTPVAAKPADANQYGGIPAAALGGAFADQANGGAAGGLLPGVRITADTVNNSLLIYARPDSFAVIERALNQIDRPKLQVAIDVTIAEVTLNDQLSYGVQFFLANHAGAIANTVSGQMPSSTSSSDPLSGGLNLIVGNSISPRVVLNALHSLTDVKILSNPSLVVVDNSEATLEVGDQVPITTGSATVLSANNAVVNTVDYKNTGIILHVQPRVNSNGNVALNIDQEISSVPQNYTGLTPTISERKVQSDISVASGQTVLLAGLISETQDKTRQGVPVLDQLPWVGGAFGTTGASTARTELIIFIRPQIIRDGGDAAMVAEELRSKMRGGRFNAVSLPAALNVGARALQ